MARQGLKPGDFSDSRRGEQRFATNRAVDVLPCRPAPELKLIPCRVVDCSLHGLALLSPEAMAIGEHFLLQLKLPSGTKVLEYAVVRCIVEADRCRVAARVTRFGTPSSERDLAAAMDELVKDSIGK